MANLINAVTWTILSFVLGGWWLLLTIPLIVISLILGWAAHSTEQLRTNQKYGKGKS